MPVFTIAEAESENVQADVLGRWLEARGVSRALLSRWPPESNDPNAGTALALISRIAAIQVQLAQHWATESAPDVSTGKKTPDELRKQVSDRIAAHSGVVETHIAEMWDRSDHEIVSELVEWFDRAEPFAKERQIAEMLSEPSALEFLPRQERVIRLKYQGGKPADWFKRSPGRKPVTHATFLRPDDPRFWQWLREEETALRRRAAREAARVVERKASEARRRAPVETRRTKTGVVTAGPKRKRRRRKPKKR
jgi:hypothetical protein